MAQLMYNINIHSITASICKGLAILLLSEISHAGVISRDLERAMARTGTHANIAVIVRFTNPVDLTSLAVLDRQTRNNRLMQALQSRAATSRAALEPLLVAQGAVQVKDLWIINAIAATVPAVAVKLLADHPAVAMVELDSFVQAGRSQRTPPSRSTAGRVPQSSVTPNTAAGEDTSPKNPILATNVTPGWNLAAVHAPDLWAAGYTGKGVVVATMDTGADLAHPDLQRKWRGGTNSWFDPHGEESTPYDALGHGTQALGVMVGDSAIGMAPDATWIAARLYNSNGRTSMSDIHRVFQWLMDPDGDPDTIDAPDVVNASWALTGRSAGTCVMEFNDDIHALKSAGIAVVFAAGNDGPLPGTSNSPSNNPGALSVGAIDRDLELARQTSRGPSACDSEAFPRLVAPGVNIRTTDISYGGVPSYTQVSGSSLAAPHVAGILALLAGAFPTASVSELEAALLRGAQASEAVDGKTAQARVDALAAYKALRSTREAPQVVGHAIALQQ